MTRAPHRFLPCFLAVAAVVLAGCGGILSEAPQRQLYRLNPPINFAARLPPVSGQLLVAVPTAPARLDTDRIALSRSPVSLDYFADAEWTDRMPLLVQTALLDAFDKSGAVPAIARDSAGLRADFIVETDIRDFSAIYDSPTGPPRVSVVFNLQLIKMPERKIVAQVSVNRQQPASANSIADIVHAFDAGLGAAAEEAVTRVVGNPALRASRASLFWTRFVRSHRKQGDG